MHHGQGNARIALQHGCQALVITHFDAIIELFAQDSRELIVDALDVDALVITKAIVNEGPKLKRWTPAAMGRATPMLKRTSHVEIVVTEAVR